MSFDPRKKAVLERMKRFEEAVLRAKEYLESGEHANWEKFKPYFVKKLKDGKELPPHRDWVKNVFLPNYERNLRRTEKLLERLNANSIQQRKEGRG